MRSAIDITVSISQATAKFCSKRWRFGEALKNVEKYSKAGPSSVCLYCAEIDCDWIEKYRDRVVQCMICADVNKAQNLRCGITICITKISKICTHVTHKCANFGTNH